MSRDILGYAARALRRLFVRAEHLSDSEIAGFLDRDLSPAERATVEAHIEGCRDCRLATADVGRLARAYADGSADSTSLPAARRPNESRRNIVALTAAVALAASVTLVIVTRSSQPGNGAAPVRSPVSADARPLIEVTAPGENERIEQASAVFSWRSTGADFYRISVSDETGSPVLVRETADTTLSLSSLPPLPRDRDYLWHVDAIADGRAASSGIRRLRIGK